MAWWYSQDEERFEAKVNAAILEWIEEKSINLQAWAFENAGPIEKIPAIEALEEKAP